MKTIIDIISYILHTLSTGINNASDQLNEETKADMKDFLATR